MLKGASSWTCDPSMPRSPRRRERSRSWRSSASRRHSAAGGVARMSHPAADRPRNHERRDDPVMPRFASAQSVRPATAALGVDYIDESECSPRPTTCSTSTRRRTPFRSSAAPRFGRGVARTPKALQMIAARAKPVRGTSSEAVRHMRAIRDGVAQLAVGRVGAGRAGARSRRAARARARGRRREQAARSCCSAPRRLDAGRRALMMELGAEGIFVGSGIFNRPIPPRSPVRCRRDDACGSRRRAARAHRDPRGSKAMDGLDIRRLASTSFSPAGQLTSRFAAR